MFEFSIIRKYLLPQRKQLSVALIACMSIGVIALVVWLVLVFLSVIGGIEKSWKEKLTSLNAHLRIQPTKKYYSSYYYHIDGVSQASSYTLKSIEQKATARSSDPYDPERDAELPSRFPSPLKEQDGSLKDPVKILYQSLSHLQKNHVGMVFQEYEIAGAMLKLELVRPASGMKSKGTESQTSLTQASYLASLPDKNPYLSSLLQNPSSKDLPRLLKREKDPAGTFTPSRERGILVAKNFQDAGVLLGDKGFLAYESMTAGSPQEQRIPVYVAGFYDPGIFSVGNKCILVPPSLTRLINSSCHTQFFDKTESNGLQIWLKDLKEVDALKKELSRMLEKAGLSEYWNILTYKEYPFAKDLMQQFQSDRYLFTLLALIILIVACSNIISLLVILVNDKKQEIGILQSMGASRKSIALIFGGCGAFMGIMSCLIGIGAALLTLHNLDSLVNLLSFLQGHAAFNTAFYGKSLPNHLTPEALKMIVIATPVLSLLAGLVPAIKACRLNPSEILRSE